MFQRKGKVFWLCNMPPIFNNKHPSASPAFTQRLYGSGKHKQPYAFWKHKSCNSSFARLLPADQNREDLEPMSFPPPPYAAKMWWWQTAEKHVGARMPRRHSAVGHFPGKSSLTYAVQCQTLLFTNCWLLLSELFFQQDSFSKHPQRWEWCWSAWVSREFAWTGIMLSTSKFNTKLDGILIRHCKWLVKDNVAGKSAWHHPFAFCSGYSSSLKTNRVG